MLVKKRLKHNVPFPKPMERPANYRPFLAVIGIIFLFSFIGVLNQVEKATLTGHAVQMISYAKSGSELFFEVKAGGIKDATLYFAEDTKNVKIFIDEIDSPSWKFNGKIYSTVKIASETPLALKKITFTLKIKEDDLLNKGFAVSDIELFVNGKKLSTTLTKKDREYVFYTAVGGELGEFAVGKEAAPVENEKTAVVGEAVQEPKPAEEAVPEEEALPPVEELPAPVAELSWWQKIVNFFRELFT